MILESYIIDCDYVKITLKHVLTLFVFDVEPRHVTGKAKQVIPRSPPELYTRPARLIPQPSNTISTLASTTSDDRNQVCSSTGLYSWDIAFLAYKFWDGSSIETIICFCFRTQMQVCPICLTNGKDLAFGCGHTVKSLNWLISTEHLLIHQSFIL